MTTLSKMDAEELAEAGGEVKESADEPIEIDEKEAEPTSDAFAELPVSQNGMVPKEQWIIKEITSKLKKDQKFMEDVRKLGFAYVG